jgi:23S rRNA pseudouridine1911/1915/1917 synthase
MVIARNPEVHTFLVAQLKARNIKREYQAIVSGVMTAGGSVDQPIGRHPRKRTQMAVHDQGKAAVTHFRIIRKYRSHTYIRLQLETGRTHQIRVHMAWLKYPIVGDPVYAGRAHLPRGASQTLINTLQTFPRQALHACALTLQHPQSEKMLNFEAPLPEDMQKLLEALKKDASESR